MGKPPYWVLYQKEGLHLSAAFEMMASAPPKSWLLAAGP